MPAAAEKPPGLRLIDLPLGGLQIVALVYDKYLYGKNLIKFFHLRFKLLKFLNKNLLWVSVALSFGRIHTRNRNGDKGRIRAAIRAAIHMPLTPALHLLPTGVEYIRRLLLLFFSEGE